MAGVPHRNDEPGYFVVIDADGAEVEESRRRVAAGFNRSGDQQIVAQLLRAMGPGCGVVFKADSGARA